MPVEREQWGNEEVTLFAANGRKLASGWTRLRNQATCDPPAISIAFSDWLPEDPPCPGNAIYRLHFHKYGDDAGYELRGLILPEPVVTIELPPEMAQAIEEATQDRRRLDVCFLPTVIGSKWGQN